MGAELVAVPPLELVGRKLRCCAWPPDQDPVAIFLARLAPGSRRTMRADVTRVARWLGFDSPHVVPWERLRYQHVAALRARAAAAGAPASANKLLTAIRCVLRECVRLGRLRSEDFQRVTDIQPVRGSRLPPGRSLSTAELRALFGAALRFATPIGSARNLALLTLLYQGALRRDEVRRLDLADVIPFGGMYKIRVRGKGDKERECYVVDAGARVLGMWLDCRGDEPGPLLYCVTPYGHRIDRRRMTAEAIWKTARALGKRAGIEKFSPHDLRRSAIGDMIDATKDLLAVSSLVGHASPTTTARYDRRGSRARLAAASALRVPFDA